MPHTKRRIAERLLMAAKVKASWGPAPSAETIRARDAERLVEEALALAAEEPAEQDIALARRLLADPAVAARGPEGIAAALVRVLRAPLPAPEELAEVNDRASPRTPRDHAAPRDYGAPRDHAGPRDARPTPEGNNTEGVWFRMDVGRTGNADPRWLLPFLCRRGHVTRQEIGRMRILDRETQFEVAPYAATRFATAARKAEGEDAHIRVEPMQPMRPQTRKPYPKRA